MKNEEIKLLDIQMTATVLFIASLVVSLVLSYNEKLRLQNLKPLFTDEEVYYINLADRILVTILALVFLYISYKDYEISDNQTEARYNYLEVIASTLVAVGSIIVLYVAINNKDQDNQLLSTETPIL